MCEFDEWPPLFGIADPFERAQYLAREMNETIRRDRSAGEKRVRESARVPALVATVPIIANDADLLKTMSRNKGWRVERAASGVLSLRAPVGGESSRRYSTLIALAGDGAESNGYVALAHAAVVLPDTSVVVVTIALLEASRWEALSSEQRVGLLPVVPDVALEVVSNRDYAPVLRSKLERLRSFGTSYVAMTDPYSEETWSDGTPPASFVYPYIESP